MMSTALELGSGSDWTAGIARMLTAQRRDGERDDDRRCHSRCRRAFSFFPRGKQFDDTWHDPKGGRTSEWLEHVGTLLKTTGFPSISCDEVNFQVFGFWQEFHCPAAFFSPSQFLHLFSTSQTQLEEAMATGPRGPVPPSQAVSWSEKGWWYITLLQSMLFQCDSAEHIPRSLLSCGSCTIFASTTQLIGHIIAAY